ncbi:MAG: helix-turn-helix transcriptional regulator [Chloroflexota bacterium]
MNPNRKYFPLYEYLKNHSQDEHFTISFAEIEEIIGNSLPRSAQTTRAWWANTPTAQSESWLSTEWVVEYVNFVTGQVTFRPKKITYRVTPIRRRPSWSSEQIKNLRQHAGWTQQDLADRMGVRQQTISEWETGLHTPRYSTSKHLNLIAKEVRYPYQVEDTADAESSN